MDHVYGDIGLNGAVKKNPNLAASGVPVGWFHNVGQSALNDVIIETGTPEFDNFELFHATAFANSVPIKSLH
jgi:hypothetical protein